MGEYLTHLMGNIPREYLTGSILTYLLEIIQLTGVTHLLGNIPLIYWGISLGNITLIRFMLVKILTACSSRAMSSVYGSDFKLCWQGFCKMNFHALTYYLTPNKSIIAKELPCTGVFLDTYT